MMNCTRGCKVLVLGTSKKTKGGVTSVINMHAQCAFWEKHHVRWIETHIDRSIYWKLWYAIKAVFQYIRYIWFYDIIHFHVGELPSAQRKFLFFTIARLLGKKTIVHLHLGNQLDTLCHKYIYRSFLLHSDATIVLSNSLKQKVNDLLFVGDKVHVIYNPCMQIPDIYYTSSHHILLFAGTLNTNKGYDILIKSFAKIASGFPEWKLVLAGSGELEKAKILINDLQISSQVDILGWIQGAEKDALFRHTSVFCLSSYAEGFPMSVLDAWSYGLPIVTTLVGGLTDVIEDNVNALTFVSGDIEGLSEKLKEIILSESLRQQLSKESLNLAHSIFSLEHINEKIEKLYSQIMK